MITSIIIPDNKCVRMYKQKSYKDIWAILHFKLSHMKEDGVEITAEDILKKMEKLEKKTR